MKKKRRSERRFNRRKQNIGNKLWRIDESSNNSRWDGITTR